MFYDRSQGERSKIAEATDYHRSADEEDSKREAIGRQSSGGDGPALLPGEPASKSKRWDRVPKPADHHSESRRHIKEGTVSAQACERLAISAEARGVCVQNLGEAVGSVVGGEAGDSGTGDQGDCGECQNREGTSQRIQHDQLHFGRPYEIAQILRGTADHEAGHEQTDERDHYYAVEAGTQSAKRYFTQEHINQGNHAAKRHIAVVHGIV